jgi:hypothetical protein
VLVLPTAWAAGPAAVIEAARAAAIARIVRAFSVPVSADAEGGHQQPPGATERSRGKAMSQSVQLFTVIVLVSLPTVMFGGYSLLRLMKTERLNAFQLTYFRAGHAHAGVLLVMSLAALSFLDRADLSPATRWTVCVLLAIGVIAQSGGMFVHMMVGQPGRWSVGNTVTTVGGVALAVTLLILAYGVATA